MTKSYNEGMVSKGGLKTNRCIGERCKCKRFMCSNISNEQRQSIFNMFWSSKSTKATRQNYIISHAEQVAKKSAVLTPKYHRARVIKYFVTVVNKRVRVCQDFFLQTLSISDQMVRYNLSKSENDIRIQHGKRVAHNKTSDDIHDGVWNHINSFPKVDSHYCRSDTKRQYLNSSLSTKKKHELYREASPDNKASAFYYRKIFNEEFNLGFHQPSKDARDSCDIYYKAKQRNNLTSEQEQSRGSSQTKTPSSGW